jgi:hypothetical protein
MRVRLILPHSRKIKTIDYVAFSTGAHVYWASGRLRNQILHGVAQYLWVLSVELASFRPPGTGGVGVASKFLGSSCTPVLLTFVS